MGAATVRVAATLLAGCLIFAAARATTVDEPKVEEYLQAFWTAALWQTPLRAELNAPVVLSKFAAARLTVAVSGADDSDHARVVAMLEPLLALTGREHAILPLGSGGSANIEPKFVSFGAGPGYDCVTTRFPANGRIQRATLEVLNTRTDRCLAHEAMHVLGFTGHPHASASILSYTYKFDTYTEIDRMMVRVLYDPRLTPGMRHMLAIATAREVLVDKLVADGAPAATREMGRRFVLGVPQELETLIAAGGLSPYGGAQAHYHLAVAYTFGDVVAKDEAAGYHRFRAAAELLPDWSELQFYIGYALHAGRGTEADPVQGVAWYQKAAAQGHTVAQNNLGNAYRSGKGVAIDRIEAYKWFQLAAARGSEFAVRNRASLAAELGAADVQEAERRAAAWKPGS